MIGIEHALGNHGVLNCDVLTMVNRHRLVDAPAG